MRRRSSQPQQCWWIIWTIATQIIVFDKAALASVTTKYDGGEKNRPHIRGSKFQKHATSIEQSRYEGGEVASRGEGGNASSDFGFSERFQSVFDTGSESVAHPTDNVGAIALIENILNTNFLENLFKKRKGPETGSEDSGEDDGEDVPSLNFQTTLDKEFQPAEALNGLPEKHDPKFKPIFSRDYSKPPPFAYTDKFKPLFDIPINFPTAPPVQQPPPTLTPTSISTPSTLIPTRSSTPIPTLAPTPDDTSDGSLTTMAPTSDDTSDGSPPTMAPTPESTSDGSPTTMAPSPDDTSDGSPTTSAPTPDGTSDGSPTTSAPAPDDTSAGLPTTSAPTPDGTSDGSPTTSAPTPDDTPNGLPTTISPTPDGTSDGSPTTMAPTPDDTLDGSATTISPTPDGTSDGSPTTSAPIPDDTSVGSPTTSVPTSDGTESATTMAPTPDGTLDGSPTTLAPTSDGTSAGSPPGGIESGLTNAPTGMDGMSTNGTSSPTETPSGVESERPTTLAPTSNGTWAGSPSGGIESGLTNAPTGMDGTSTNGTSSPTETPSRVGSERTTAPSSVSSTTTQPESNTTQIPKSNMTDSTAAPSTPSESTTSSPTNLAPTTTPSRGSSQTSSPIAGGNEAMGVPTGSQVVSETLEPTATTLEGNARSEYLTGFSSFLFSGRSQERNQASEPLYFERSVETGDSHLDGMDWVQTMKFSGSQEEDYGSATDMNLDATVFVAGAPASDKGGIASGEVRLYNPYADSMKIVTFVGSAGDELGTSVSISGDGDLVAVGARGYVDIYSKTADNHWFLRDTIEGDGNRHFGEVVALSSDGSTLIVGSGNEQKVRVYEYQTKTWAQKGQTLSASGESDVEFGSSVSINFDGSIIAVGIPGGTTKEKGSVRVYQESKGGGMTSLFRSVSWELYGVELSGYESNDGFGTAISLSTNGDRVAVGAYRQDNGQSHYVAAYDYDQDSSTWKLVGQVLNGYVGTDLFGTSVSLSGSGDSIAIGAITQENSRLTEVWGMKGSQWKLVGSKIRKKAYGKTANAPVVLAEDGMTVLVGAPLEGSIEHTEIGNICLFDLAPMI